VGGGGTSLGELCASRMGPWHTGGLCPVGQVFQGPGRRLGPQSYPSATTLVMTDGAILFRVKLMRKGTHVLTQAPGTSRLYYLFFPTTIASRPFG